MLNLIYMTYTLDFKPVTFSRLFKLILLLYVIVLQKVFLAFNVIKRIMLSYER